MALFPSSMRVGWRQLTHSKTKLLVACAGVVVAVMLMLVQLGIRRGAIDSSVAVASRITADVVVLSQRTKSMFQPSNVSRTQLYRLLGHPAVDSVQELYIGRASFKNPWTNREFPIAVYGLDAGDPMMDLPGFAEKAGELRFADTFVFDAQSRPTYGPVSQEVAEKGFLETEINHRRVKMVDAVPIGISINVDGNLYTTPANFLRIFPNRAAGSIDVGLVRLRSGSDAVQVTQELSEILGSEARAVARQNLVDEEIQYLRETAPLDFIFGMGAAVGFFIGFVVVYQILYTEVTNHLSHYATLKAMGFDDGYLRRIVMTQATLLASMGYVPGFVLALAIYSLATSAIQMPIEMSLSRASFVYLTTVSMCGVAGLVALRRLASADPADVF